MSRNVINVMLTILVVMALGLAGCGGGEDVYVVYEYVSVPTSSTAVAKAGISGTITYNGTGLSGVTIRTTGGLATTDASGNYTITGLASGSYTLTPSKAGYTFIPVSKVVIINNSNVTEQNFTATVTPTFSISGTITYNGTGLSGVTISTTGGSVTTDGSGNYTITGLANGNYTVTASSAAFIFSAPQAVTINNANVSNVDFTATANSLPSQPINVVATATSDTVINLTWGAAADPDGNFDHYLIYMKALGENPSGSNKVYLDMCIQDGVFGADVTKIFSTQSLVANIRQLIPNNSYIFSVLAVDSLGALSAGPCVAATTLPSI